HDDVGRYGAMPVWKPQATKLDVHGSLNVVRRRPDENVRKGDVLASVWVPLRRLSGTLRADDDARRGDARGLEVAVREVERSGDVRRLGIAHGQRLEPPAPLHQLEDRRVVVGPVRNAASAGER